MQAEPVLAEKEVFGREIESRDRFDPLIHAAHPWRRTPQDHEAHRGLSLSGVCLHVLAALVFGVT
jgi:hypothetical protein